MIAKKFKILFMLGVINPALAVSLHSQLHKQLPQVVWVPTFYAITPRLDIKNPVSREFCLTHTPNTLSTTIGQIKKGLQAENGVYIKYLSYTTAHRHGLGFNVVRAKVWTVDLRGHVTWSSPMWEYQQNLSEVGVTNVVWATNVCKGKFLGVAVVRKP